jgi:pyruvate kinase
MLPARKTKIVATIGPASESEAVLEQLILAGMDIARLNFSHGDFAKHEQVIGRVRSVSEKLGRRVALMADLPGPKMRIGNLEKEPIELRVGDEFSLSTAELIGNEKQACVTFPRLAQVVKPGNLLYLNDGLIQLEVLESREPVVRCKVLVGGELRSRKGLNLPGIDLGMCAFTQRDRECLEFALAHGVEAISQSFVERASDIEVVRQAAAACGKSPFIIAKIERAGALKQIPEILAAADGIMVARGDLGVEIPIEQMALVQKQLLEQANLAGKPVITATQMLESMVDNPRPTRAESTDVANAILDGTDCVMLSAESAMGRYPAEAVCMLSKIAAATEVQRPSARAREILKLRRSSENFKMGDLISLNVESTLEHVDAAVVIVPTRSGYTARMVSRFRLPIWVVSVSHDHYICQGLQFSSGVFPICPKADPGDWSDFARVLILKEALPGRIALLTAGPSPKNPHANNRLEIIDIRD